MNITQVLLSIVALTLELQNYDLKEHEIFVLIALFLLLSIGIVIISAIVAYNLSLQNRNDYIRANRTKEENSQYQKILGYLLPPIVKERVRDGVRFIAEKHENVTILFCDICEFEQIMQQHSPLEFLAILDDLYQKFDKLCDLLGVTKIETVGKTYMACGGLKIDSENDPSSSARRVIELALSMIDATIETSSPRIQVKIGINSGDVIAGVVGSHKPQFSLVGDTVNTASRMCSTIQEPYLIQMSTETYQLLDKQGRIGLRFDQSFVVPKGKQGMVTYFVSEMEKAVSNEDSYSFKETFIFSSTRRNSRRSKTPIEIVDFHRGLSTAACIKAPLTNSNEQKICKADSQLQFFSSRFLNPFFTGTDQDKAILQSIRQANYGQYISGMIVIACVSIFVTATYIFSWYLIDEFIKDYLLFARITTSAALLFAVLIYRLQILKQIFPYIYMGLLSATIVIICLPNYCNGDNERRTDINTVELLFFKIAVAHMCGVQFRITLWTKIGLGIYILTIYSQQYDSSNVHAGNTIFLFLFSIVNLCTVYVLEKQMTENFLQNLKNQKETENTKALLTQMIPPKVKERLEANLPITDILNDVTLLYADIVGFTAWSAGRTPSEVIEMLSDLFTNFDKMCVKHKVYKVHTIGDCYVVMGQKLTEEDTTASKCMNVVNFARSMIRAIEWVNSDHKSELGMRIGMHTGRVVAGVTGTNIVRYDIYGEDVLIANKMESEGQSGKINVSERTREILEANYPEKFRFEGNVLVEIPSINREYMSYFMEYVNPQYF